MELSTIDGKVSLLWIELKFLIYPWSKRKEKTLLFSAILSQRKKIFSLLFGRKLSLDHSNLFQPTRILQAVVRL